MNGDAKSPQHTVVHPIGNNNSNYNSGSKNTRSRSQQQQPQLNHIESQNKEQQQRKRLYQSKSPALNSVSPMSLSMSMSMSPQTTSSLSYASLQNSNPQLSNSNYSICNDTSSGHFARIHYKPKAPKSLPDIKYAQVTSARLSRNLEEDEDSFSLHNLSPNGDNGVTYVPFQSPTPNSLFVENNNVGTPHIAFSSHPEQAHNNNNNNNSNNNHYPYEQHGLPLPLSLPTISSYKQLPRPTQIPLPTVPIHSCHVEADPESELTLSPPPPPVPRPHIFQPRLGQAPYPDLSPEIAEKYAMPTQHVPSGSPMVRRSQRRPRPHPAPANFCDQIRDTPPGYMLRAHSEDRLEEQPVPAQSQSQSQSPSQSAPHVNRRSGRKARPRSFCNSIVGAQA
ncbi:uncharacterized protein Dmoj_GI26400 [Drosophila mojavensis]|uniref:Uncharacterized protein n=1 Tax=Drosophila mojavensis TaxID=7230 RepID=A0A0Q9X6U9_DROMO|nr:uncharacterized protein Dmoj_GI26400 [Drosophila mojavensis]